MQLNIQMLVIIVSTGIPRQNEWHPMQWQ